MLENVPLVSEHKTSTEKNVSRLSPGPSRANGLSVF